MKESDLYPPVRDWLLARGYEIHVEIFDADIVAVKDGRLTVVELKLCLSTDLWMQCRTRATWADEVIAAVASTPRCTEAYQHSGFGVLIVQDGRVKQKHKPRPQPWHWHKARAYRMKKLAKREPAQPHEMAGVPSSRKLKEQRLARLPANTPPAR